MAKKTPFVPKEPVAKLPLAVRKDVRDKFEAEKEDWEAQIAQLLGIDKFTINFNPNLVWAYAEESDATKGQANAGNILGEYAKGFIRGLTSYVEEYKDEGKKDFVEAVSASEVTLDANPAGNDANDILSAEIKEGVWRILFRPNCLGYNVSSMSYSEFIKVVDSVRSSGFSLKAKNNIEEYYENQIDDLKEKIVELLNMKDIVLDPNFEENYEKLKAGKKDDDWQGSFGRATYEYFEGFKRELESNGFAGDDLLQEGFAEAVPSKTVRIRIVPKLKASSGMNEPILEDDVLFLQTTVDNWYYNTSSIAGGMINLM